MWPCVPDQFGSYLEMSLLDQEGKPEFPEKNLSEQRREPTTNRSTQIWRRIRESNPGHTSAGRVLLSLRQPCYFATSTRSTFFVPQFCMSIGCLLKKWKNGYAKFWEANEVYYGTRGSGDDKAKIAVRQYVFIMCYNRRIKGSTSKTIKIEEK